jgi:hypothetical protein
MNDIPAAVASLRASKDPQKHHAADLLEGAMKHISELEAQVRFLIRRREAATEQLRSLGHDVGGL